MKALNGTLLSEFAFGTPCLTANTGAANIMSRMAKINIFFIAKTSFAE
jgi:hypothetical protein